MIRIKVKFYVSDDLKHYKEINEKAFNNMLLYYNFFRIEDKLITKDAIYEINNDYFNIAPKYLIREEREI